MQVQRKGGCARGGERSSFSNGDSAEPGNRHACLGAYPHHLSLMSLGQFNGFLQIDAFTIAEGHDEGPVETLVPALRL